MARCGRRRRNEEMWYAGNRRKRNGSANTKAAENIA